MNRQMVFGGTHKLAIAVSAVVLLFLLLIPSSAFAANDPTYAVKVDRGYLALRTALGMTLRFIEEKGAKPCGITADALRYYEQTDRR